MYTTVEKSLLNDPSATKTEAFPLVWKTFYPKIKSKSKKCQNNAYATGVLLHQSDFESQFCLALWEASIAFSQYPTYQFIHIYTHRLRLAELNIWQSVKVSGNRIDKDQQTFQKGLVVSSDSSNELSSIPESLDLYHFLDALSVFKADHKNEWKSIYLLYIGFQPNEIISLLYKEPYTSKYRKKIERSRELFKKYYYD
ncbi:hypothetical protein [Furfurilactobacillus entadae]|uniref:hypothetical protein n=1 Tax=Furfurilactobacillus entadae TaxID=2922307 RepID=UPI0035E89F61